MKTMKLTAGFIFLFQALYGQNISSKTYQNFDAETGALYQQTKYQYQYDGSDNVVEETTSYWDTSQQNFLEYARMERDYEGNRVKEIRHYGTNSEDGSVELKRKVECTYDENGLLVEQERARYYSEEEIEKVIFANEFDSAKPWKNRQDWIQSFFTPLRRVARIRTDTSELELFEEYGTDSMWYFLGRRERLYDAQDRLIAYYNSYTDFGSDHLQRNKYDHPAGLITESEYYTKDDLTGEWRKRNIVQHLYLLDESDKVLKWTRIGTSYDYSGAIEKIDTTLINNYYYCNGLLERQDYRTGSETVGFSILYEYEGQIDCNDPSVDLTIYPNPAQGWVSIRTNILKENGCVITLFTVDGKKVRQIKLPESLEQYELDLTPYDRGVMIIQIQSQENRAVGKLVKMN